MRNKQGFTIMELLLVVGIIGILVAIAIPAVKYSTHKAQEVTCRANRETLYRRYRYETAFAGQTQQDAVQRMRELAEESGYEVSIQGNTLTMTGLCPSDGIITATIGSDLSCDMICSVHPTTGGDDDEPIIPIDDLRHKNWMKALQAAENSHIGGIFLWSGTVWEDDTGIYAMLWDCYLSKDEGEQKIELQTFSHQNPGWMAKLDLNVPPLTEADTQMKHGHRVWKPDRIPNRGTIAQVGEDYYVCTIDSMTYWTVTTDVANSILWEKIS